jgi:glutamate/tyrosine decarboxylase-like PLP-dependent enzyme
LENSRRFRALPVYAVLLSEGRERLAQMFARQVRHARGIAMFLRESDEYELLPNAEASLEETHVIVLFRAKDPELNDILVRKINENRRIFVSGTSWMGKKAVRIAVANWQANVERDLPVVKEALLEIVASSSSKIS